MGKRRRMPQSQSLKKMFPCLILIFAIENVEGHKTNCTMLRDVFTNSTSDFISCAIQNSRPITLCESCVVSYLKLEKSYLEMFKLSDNGTACIDNFIHLDRLEIIETLYKNSYDLWNRAKCYECFKIVNGTVSSNRSEELEVFNELYSELMNCVNRSDVNDTTLCPICMDAYLILNEYYLEISNMNEKIGMCMDMVDLMNNTWTFWSDKCCKYRKHNEYIFLSSTVMVMLLTVTFYLLTKFSTVRSTPTILSQTRFAESLNQITSPDVSIEGTNSFERDK